jgi:hypothetical protein
MAGASVIAVVIAALAAISYPLLWRRRCLTWGATPDEVSRELPGDELLPDASLVSTRAVSISAPPGDIWPWLVQMGSGRAGAYSYDWIENLLGLDMHSADVILPQFQDVAIGDEFPLGSSRAAMRVEVLDRDDVFTLRSTDGDWVWIFALFPEDGITRLVSRNRIITPGTSATPSTSAAPGASGASRLARLFSTLVMEPGSLVMERKMLLGIKERAERLAQGRQPLRR